MSANSKDIYRMIERIGLDLNPKIIPQIQDILTIVEASSPEEAEKKARRLYNGGEDPDPMLPHDWQELDRVGDPFPVFKGRELKGQIRI